jgi:hypothetical protein
MLLIKIVISISLMKLIAAGAVTCNKTNTMHRTRYRSYIEKGGDVFMAVSFSSIKEESEDRRSIITKKIEEDFSQIQMPIAFATQRELAYINIKSDMGSYHQSGFDFVQESFLKNISFLTQEKVYIYKEFPRAPIKQTEVAFFHACRVFKESKDEMKVEKSILVLILGSIKDEKEITRSVETTLMNMTVFKFDEFEDQDYAICEHLNFYLNECFVNGLEI